MKLIGAFLGMVCGLLSAQEPRTQRRARLGGRGDTPTYRLTLTQRTVKAINYQHRGGATRIDFRGTDLLPGAVGEAKVEGKRATSGSMRNSTACSRRPKRREYLTYVLWAVTPEGRTANLGEVLLDGEEQAARNHRTAGVRVGGHRRTLLRGHPAQRPDCDGKSGARGHQGQIEEIDAKYELLQRGQYQRLANPLALQFDRKQPLELYEARNAVQIARAVGADRFAAETFQKAEASLSQAEAYQASPRRQ
jgi:hypothetical protein